MQQNPIKAIVLAQLRRNSTTRLTDLAVECGDALAGYLSSESEIRSFQTNFLLMNALFQLQAELLEQEFYLQVDIMDLRILPVTSADEFQLARQSQSELAAYYLDWSNLEGVTQAEVDALLANFWQQYSLFDKSAWAAETLGVAANADKHEVRTAYRRLASESHPDRGGSATRFMEVREAWEILK